MHCGHREAVTGDADESYETLVARLDRRLERAAFAQRGLPLDHVDEVVQLDQVDAVDAEPVERAADLLPRALVVALAGLRRDEEARRARAQPRRDAELRVAVRGGGVDVVDAVREQQLERALGVRLRDADRAPRRRRSSACCRGRCCRTALCDHATDSSQVRRRRGVRAGLDGRRAGSRRANGERGELLGDHHDSGQLLIAEG